MPNGPARYKRFDLIPPGFTRQISLRDVKPGDELLWSDDSPVYVVTQIEQLQQGNGSVRPYRLETRPKDSPTDSGPKVETLNPKTKLFIRPQG